MKARKVVLMPATDMGPSGTKVIDLNISDIISRIDIEFQAKVVTVSVMTGMVAQCISRVEIVDGGNTLISATGPQLCANNTYNRKRLPPHTGTLTVDGYQKQTMSIDFGRWLYDEDFAFPAKMYNNPQLRITYDEDASNGSVVINSMSVHAEVMTETKKTPQYFIAVREWKNYTFGTSSHELTSLPTDKMIKSLMFNPLSTDHSPVDLINTIKASLDNDKFVLCNMLFSDFEKQMSEKYPRFSYGMTLDAVVTAKTIYANLSDKLKIAIQYDDTAFVTAQSKFAVASYTGGVITLTASVDIQADEAEISGTCPFNTVMWQFGDEWDVDQWLDPRQYKSFDLDILSSSDADTGDTCSVVLEIVQPVI